MRQVRGSHGEHRITVQNSVTYIWPMPSRVVFLLGGRSPRRESTLISDRGRIARHIKPILGRMTVAAVTTDNVESMMHAILEGATAATTKTKPRGVSVVRGGRGVATRTVGLLGAIFTFAIRKKFRADNPVRGVMRFADGRRLRRLTDQEYRAIGTALENAVIEDMRPSVIAATKFMLLTGWRGGEVLGLRWSDLDLDQRPTRYDFLRTHQMSRPRPSRPRQWWKSLASFGSWKLTINFTLPSASSSASASSTVHRLRVAWCNQPLISSRMAQSWW
jgi:integrase